MGGCQFYQADGKPKPVGTKLVNQAYAQVLRQIAQQGADAFYKGEIARDIVATVTHTKLQSNVESRAESHR